MQLSLPLVDAATIEELPIDLWRELFNVTGWPKSIGGKRNAFTHDDVLSALAARRRDGQFLVGFAAEHGAGAVDYGRGKLERKRLDAVVVNDIARKDIGFEGVENEVTIVTAAGELHVPRTSKAAVARAVLDTVTDLRTTHRATA